MDKPISTLMSPDVTTVRADDTIEAVGATLRSSGLTFVPVVDAPGDTVLGIISAEDIVRFEGAKRDPASVRAWEICSYKPVEVTADASACDVARLMVERQVHHVVVMDEDSLVGVVSSLDYVKEFIK
ncbi:CBS domain-containing protein [Massilia cavernae]|uniref:CBS domain-containing protein n=1 Tax=Massilia cavernae TaxID=2320864 RepID=A0A418XQV5_9BURK|nr:CBS domain-containing protein [Massilia cavernae]RJG14882.1 CBS domain-containing protein [Massilia cavernae]